MNPPPDTRKRYMMRALELASAGLGRCSPNPAVGAVAVRDGEIIAEGGPTSFGGYHAEAALIASVADRLEILDGADLYVTLEPCSHHGKTPPCSDAIIAARFRSVTFAAQDPNPLTAGRAREQFAVHGIQVESGLLEAPAKRVIAGYLKWMRTRRPLVTAKWAMSADGHIATRTGDSKWISSSATLARTRRERSHYDAILVGRGTMEADDPRLLADVPDDPDAPTPLRVLLDSNLALTAQRQLVATCTRAPLVVFVAESHRRTGKSWYESVANLDIAPVSADASGGLRLDDICEELGRRGITHMLVEGGPTVHGAFFDAGLVDRVQIIFAPKLIGGVDSPAPIAGHGVATIAECAHFELTSCDRVSDDVVISGDVTSAARGD